MGQKHQTRQSITSDSRCSNIFFAPGPEAGAVPRLARSPSLQPLGEAIQTTPSRISQQSPGCHYQKSSTCHYTIIILISLGWHHIKLVIMSSSCHWCHSGEPGWWLTGDWVQDPSEEWTLGPVSPGASHSVTRHTSQLASHHVTRAHHQPQSVAAKNNLDFTSRKKLGKYSKCISLANFSCGELLVRKCIFWALVYFDIARLQLNMESKSLRLRGSQKSSIIFILYS